MPTFNELVSEYNAWLEINGGNVPKDWDHNADELRLHHDWFTQEQLDWLNAFCDRWDEAQEEQGDDFFPSPTQD